MKYTATSLLLAGSLLAPAQAMADLLLWQDNSLTYLNGVDFKIDPPRQQTLTFEHASGWSVGDLFLFVDGIKYNTEATNGAGDGHTFYGEISPRLSFGKISGADLSFGPVKDVLVSATYEFGEDDVDAYLLGPAVDLAIPGFDYFQLNTYLLGPAVDLAIPGFDYFQLNTYLRRPDGKRDGRHVWQITPAWSYTVPVGNSDLVIDGFIDWVVDNDDSYHANLHINPQIKYDLAKAMGWGKKFYVGVEYDYWKHKYGIDNDSPLADDLGGSNQSAISLLAKAHF